MAAAAKIAKMREKIASAAVSLGVFCALFYGTFILFPYVVTSQNYSGSDNVSDLFPIAIIESGNIQIVKWRSYLEKPEEFKGKLLLVPSKGKLGLSENEHFTLEFGRNKSLVLSLYEEDYRFWAEYSVENGLIKPISYRFTGAFVILYCFLVALVGTQVIAWLRRRAGVKLFIAQL